MDKYTYRVSIIMGIYNCADTLRESVDSILSQTYNDWELIMCDDASNDNGKTLYIAQDYADKYENIKVIRNNKNLGLAATLNHCLEHANGEFIGRMDGDDISLPTRFQKEVEFLDKHPEYAFVSSGMICFDENGEWGRILTKEKPQKKDFIKSSPFCHAPVLMRKSILSEIGNYTVRPSLRRGQDYYLWHKFYASGYKGYNLSEPLYKMRDDKNATNRRTLRVRLNAVKTRWEVLSNLKLPFVYRIYAFRPIIVALTPRFIYNYIHKRK